MSLSRRNLFRWLPALALAPVVSKLVPAATEVGDTVRYGGGGVLYDATYISQTYPWFGLTDSDFGRSEMMQRILDTLVFPDYDPPDMLS